MVRREREREMKTGGRRIMKKNTRDRERKK